MFRKNTKHNFKVVKRVSLTLFFFLFSASAFAANLPPRINSVTPPDNSTFLAGAGITITINASDPNSDPLQYQFSIGGTVKQVWSSSKTYLWQTSASDTGSVNITCQARDNRGGATSKTITYRIINPTISQILQKVAANYAFIQDFKADMTLSSTLNSAPFGTTDYCRYYFKVPDKEKTETFSNSSRTKKTEIIIINGSTMCLIDPVRNIKQQVDLLQDAGINSTQFRQTDIYYNRFLFLNKHTVTKNSSLSRLDSMLIALDAVPKTTNNIYDKLTIVINYSKGIISRFLIYRKNSSGQLELAQETKTITSQKMPNNAWLPVKMTKSPNLTSGNLISTLTYSNLQVNIGLTDADFNPDSQ